MSQVDCKYLEQTGQEVNAVEHLSCPIQAPVKELKQGHQSVGLVHVVAVLPDRRKGDNNFDD